MTDRSSKPAPPDTVADAMAGNWLDRWAPAALKPYGRLARFDRPIGAWLLLFPCWWSQTLAELSLGRHGPDLWSLALFFVGAFVMRGAGCTHNDIVDRDYDASVARTRSRPIPSGAVTVGQALMFAVALSLIGFLVLVQFNRFTVWLGIGSLLLVALYPFAKRYTDWPQAVLGLTFKWGALVGWAAVTGGLGLPAVALYAGSVLWTIGYDTIYAHQDTDDDATLGLGSTALRFGEASPRWIAGFYGGAWVFWLAAGLAAGGGPVLVATLVVVAAHFAWQVATLDIHTPANCLVRFRSNQWIGWIVFAGIVLEMLLVNAAWAP